MLPEQSETDEEVVRTPFTERDVREAARLLGLIASLDRSEELSLASNEAGDEVLEVDREVLLSRAKKHFRKRQLRKDFFSRAIFGEPAWDTLIVLYVNEFFGRRVTVGKLADWIEAPLSTTQRWIAYLEKERLVAKEGHPNDRRIAYVRLLDKGRTTLEKYLSAAAD